MNSFFIFIINHVRPLLTILLFKVTDSIRDTTDSISFSLSLTYLLYVPSESSGNEADPVQNSF